MPKIKSGACVCRIKPVFLLHLWYLIKDLLQECLTCYNFKFIFLKSQVISVEKRVEKLCKTRMGLWLPAIL